jgi:DNA-binding winged helix-turn-helix (wHTH) protein/TolB-like protein
VSAGDPAGRYRFDGVELDAATGELSRDAGGGERTVVRLPPQPARLLVHLIRRRPHLVSRDEIRSLLWSDVAVEFEQGLHSCVRQIRVALDDSAADPQFIETIPRRGYRFLGNVDIDPEPARPEASVADPPSPGSARSGRVLAAGLVLALGLAAIVAAAAMRSNAAPPAPLRIAVMPFEPVAETSAFAPGNELAESIVERLSNQTILPVEVVGPTTTGLYDGSPQRLRDLIEDFAIDFVVNARDSATAEGPRALIEVIRASDGAHVWVARLEMMPTGADVPAVVVQGVLDRAR